jgi:Carboxypeptidase regulatory-like domain
MRKTTLILALALLMASGIAFAVSTTGSLIGTVKDAAGEPLPGVTVTIASPSLIGGSKSEVTAADGTFRFLDLAPGIYTAKAELEGFLAQEVQNVQVRLDRSAAIYVTMPQGQFTENVTVTTEAPLLDPTQASVAQTYDKNYLRDLPIGSGGRDYLSVLQAAPGSVSDGNPNVFGSLNSENAYYIDGTDTTDPVTSTFGTNFNYDAIEEISYITAGYEAEYGRAIGGVINLVTKSGGNNFAGTLDVRYQTNDFSEKGDHFDPDLQESKSVIPGATLGGPVLRDKLWFFGSYEDISTEVTPFQSQDTRTFEGQNYIGKLTYKISDSWQAVVKGSGDPADISNSNADATTATEATSLQTQGGKIYQAEVSGVFTPNLLWDLGLGQVRSDLDVVPQRGDFTTPGHTDFFTGETYINYSNAQFSNRDRDEYRTSLTYLVDDFGGSHEFKGGFEQSDMEFGFQSNTIGGIRFDDNGRDPFVMNILPITPANNFDGQLRSGYLQDAWRVIPELTLRIGVRYDTVLYNNDAGTEVANMDKVQPRIGFAYDVSKNARTVVRGSWGRFMHPASVGLPFLVRVNSAPQDQYLSCSAFIGTRQDCIDIFGAENIINDPVGFEPEGWFFNQRFSSSPTTLQDNLEPTYADQWNIGVQQQFGARTVLDVSYLEKKTRDIFEDTCVGNFPTPSAGSNCDFYTIGNIPGLARDYKGFVVEVRSQAQSWLNLRGNYVYGDSKGNIGNTQYAGVDFDLFPDHFRNSYGYLEDQAKHRARLDAYARLPLDFGIALSGSYASEFRYDALRALDPNTSYGDEYVEPRGSRKGNEIYNFDFQVAKGFTFGPVRAQLIASVENLLNQEQVTQRCDRVDGCGGGIDFTEPLEFANPRRYEAGFRLEF